ncbi:MAG: UDP-N-acetylmuramoyl-tripeptide--D-alanyl-D-alanine ligase [Candidatus Omnitrophota bacterium]
MLISNLKTLEELLNPVKAYNLNRFKPIEGFSIDSRVIKKGEAFVAIKGKHYDGRDFIQEAVSRGAGAVIAQEYIDIKSKPPFFIVNNTYSSLEALAVYIRQKKNPIVCAVTGSVGKTTTKEMLSFLLEPHFKVLKNKKTENNLLGLVKTIFSLKDERIAVLELGTSSKGEIELLSRISKPDIGVITFIKPVHLEGLGNLKGILEEKTSIFKSNRMMIAVLNRDDSFLAKVKGPAKTYFFGRNKDSDIFSRLVKKEKTILTFLIQGKYKLRLPSYLEGFITNYLAAITAARILDIKVEESVERMNDFYNFAPMRMQMSEIGNFLILNDAYNANPYSFERALESLKNYSFRKIAVIGDMLELGEKSAYYHKQLAFKIAKGNFDYCLSFGKHTQCLRDKLKELGHKKAFHFETHQAIADFINRKQQAAGLNKKYLIFLKGSRSMELEKVIEYLK